MSSQDSRSVAAVAKGRDKAAARARTDVEARRERSATGWTFLSNHAHVLICIARDPDVRVRDISREVGITDRATQRILNELVEAEVLERERRGRRNHYAIRQDSPLRHPLESHHSVGDLLRALEE